METREMGCAAPGTAVLARPLDALGALVGRWRVTGRMTAPDAEIAGTVAFSWMEGGGFLIQEIDVDQGGTAIRAIEYIGWNEESGELCSHCFDAGGAVLEYTWQIEEDALTIWSGGAGSVAAFRGRLSPDGSRLEGRWEWPGGGFGVAMTRCG